MIVETEDGLLRGKMSDGVATFLGIPYATPPVADLRWRPPRRPDPWSGVRPAVDFGPACAQTSELGGFSAKSSSEDCLYLNVFTPNGDGVERRLPVMVWIHGGGLFAGASDPYDGTELARQGDVVVVTVNYRLNVFGFLAHPAFDAEGHAFGNYGFMDQQLALGWVRDNIHAFGGDSDNVTIFGQSSGGRSVLAHLVSRLSTGLFHRAIIQSGAELATVDATTAEYAGTAFAEAVGGGRPVTADAGRWLRSVPVEEIWRAAPQFLTTVPPVTLDGAVLDRAPEEAFASGDFNRVPIMIGSTKDEASWFTGLDELASGEVLTSEQYSPALRGLFGAAAESVMGEYLLGAYGSPAEALAAARTDGLYSCPSIRLTEDLARYTPVWFYEFADRTAPSYMPAASVRYGAYHTGEIQYLFSGFHGATGIGCELNDEQRKLSEVMLHYWSTFARTGDPNSGTTPNWPRYSAENGEYQSLTLPQPTTNAFSELRAEHHSDFWDELDR